jgi:hypothetical protein
MKKSLFLHGTAVLTLALALSPVAVEASNRLTLDQAVQKCTDRAVIFGRTPFGRFGESPPENLVQDQYRACVYANSKQYPVAKVQYRDSVLTLLRDAFK